MRSVHEGLLALATALAIGCAAPTEETGEQQSAGALSTSVATEECIVMSSAYHRAEVGDLRAVDEAVLPVDVRTRLRAEGFFTTVAHEVERSSSLRRLETPELGTLYIKSLVVPIATAGSNTLVDHGITIIDIHDSKGFFRVQGATTAADGRIVWSQVFVGSDGKKVFRTLGTLDEGTGP